MPERAMQKVRPGRVEVAIEAGRVRPITGDAVDFVNVEVSAVTGVKRFQAARADPGRCRVGKQRNGTAGTNIKAVGFGRRYSITNSTPPNTNAGSSLVTAKAAQNPASANSHQSRRPSIRIRMAG